MCADRHGLRGQALVECLVAALVLVPLVLLVAWLGKVDAMRHAAIGASRMLAFECTVRPDDCRAASTRPELADELRRRAFGRIDVPVLTQDRAADTPADRSPLWVDRANRPLLERFADVAIRIDAPSFDAGRSVAGSRGGSLVSGALTLADTLAGPARFGLELNGGLVDARVQVAITPGARSDGFRGQLDSIPLRLRANTAILTDAWNASGPYGSAADSVDSRVGRGKRLPGPYETTLDARYALTRGFIAVMDAIGLEPAGGAFRYHEIDVDRVPADRVGSAGETP